MIQPKHVFQAKFETQPTQHLVIWLINGNQVEYSFEESGHGDPELLVNRQFEWDRLPELLHGICGGTEPVDFFVQLSDWANTAQPTQILEFKDDDEWEWPDY